MAWGWLKGLGKVAGGLVGLGGDGIDYDRLAQTIGAAGAGFGAYGQGQAQNRGVEFAGQIDLARALMEREQMREVLEGSADRDHFDQTVRREQEGRAGGQDAWRRLMASQRTLSPSARPQLSPYAVAPRQGTDLERQGAEAMSSEVMARLQGGNPIAMPTRREVNLPGMDIDPSLLRPGTGERTAGWLSPILGFLGRTREPVSSGYR